LAVVHRCRSGQPRQAAPKVTDRFGVIGRTRPFGQVTVPAGSLTVKSSTPNPPGTVGLVGHGLTSGMCPALSSSLSASPVP